MHGVCAGRTLDAVAWQKRNDFYSLFSTAMQSFITFCKIAHIATQRAENSQPSDFRSQFLLMFCFHFFVISIILLLCSSTAPCTLLAAILFGNSTATQHAKWTHAEFLHLPKLVHTHRKLCDATQTRFSDSLLRSENKFAVIFHLLLFAVAFNEVWRSL